MAHFANRFHFGMGMGMARKNTSISTSTGTSTLTQQSEVPFIPENPESSLYTIKAYRFRTSKNSWKHIISTGLALDPDFDSQVEGKKPPVSTLRIITWNVDFMSSHPEERLSACLRHIEDVVLQCKEGEAPVPCVILLQEVLATAIPHLLRDEWVRRWFVVTPLTRDKWPTGSQYGNITLVARSLSIAECHILHFGMTSMTRTAVCVKLNVNHPGPSNEKAVLSIINTHLESLPQGADERPRQMELCSRFLTLEGVHGGVIAGDMNAIVPDDARLPKDYGLRDAWRRGEVDAGKTWGYQGQNAGNFPCNRLDKILFLPGMGYKVDEPRRIGVGVKINEDSNQALWASDHYGLDTTLHMLKPKSNSA